MALPPQQFCVRWNSYHTNLQSWFPRLLLSEQFADVTLACESRQLRCHKVVLSACSAYLERLLSQNPCKHPIVLMRDMRFSEMQALVDFMYKGEVNVTQEELPSLLKSAEALQIRGLCSNDNSPSSGGEVARESKDFAVASDALLANAQRNNEHMNGPLPPPAKTATPPTPPPNGTKKKEESPDVKEETVEEDGLYYGELDNDHMEYNEDEETGKPSGSLGQTSDYPIANVQCQYDSPSDTEAEESASVTAGPTEDHTYGARATVDLGNDEPPAFVIHQTSQLQTVTQFADFTPKIMTIAPGYPSVNLIHVSERPHSNMPHFAEIAPKIAPSPTMKFVQPTDRSLNNVNCKFAAIAPKIATSPSVDVTQLNERTNNTTSNTSQSQPAAEYNINKRIRRSEVVLRAAADCVSRGLTFQTVSEQFNIPISTIRFFMARKGILPRRRRGRSTQVVRASSSPEPPFHMQHYKLPDMLAYEDTRE